MLLILLALSFHPIMSYFVAIKENFEVDGTPSLVMRCSQGSIETVPVSALPLRQETKVKTHCGYQNPVI